MISANIWIDFCFVAPQMLIAVYLITAIFIKYIPITYGNRLYITVALFILVLVLLRAFLSKFINLPAIFSIPGWIVVGTLVYYNIKKYQYEKLFGLPGKELNFKATLPLRAYFKWGFIIYLIIINLLVIYDVISPYSINLQGIENIISTNTTAARLLSKLKSNMAGGRGIVINIFTISLAAIYLYPVLQNYYAGVLDGENKSG